MAKKDKSIKFIYSNYLLTVESAEHFLYLADKLDWSGTRNNHIYALESLLGRIAFLDVGEFEHDFALVQDLVAMRSGLKKIEKSNIQSIELDDCKIKFKRQEDLLQVEFDDGYAKLSVLTNYEEFREFLSLSIDLVMNYYELKLNNAGKTL